MPQPARSSAQEQLIEHRVVALEATAAGARQVERDVDHLKLIATHTQETLTEFKAEVRERDVHHSRSLERLHERLDETLQAVQAQVADLVQAAAREDGAQAARRGMWKSLPVLMSASAAVVGVIVALLALILN